MFWGTKKKFSIKRRNYQRTCEKFEIDMNSPVLARFTLRQKMYQISSIRAKPEEFENAITSSRNA